MRKNTITFYFYAVLALFVVVTFFYAFKAKLFSISSGVIGVRGKSPSLPISDILSPEETLAQDLALSEPRVLDLTTGKKSEVFAIQRVGMDFPSGSAVCVQSDCRQVEVYLWQENAAITVITNLDSREVLDVLYQPGFRPPLSASLIERAVRIIYEAPEVVDVLGYQPRLEDISPMQGDLLESSCDGSHICASATFEVGNRVLWATADLTEDRFAGLAWTDVIEDQGLSEVFTPDVCPQPGAINRDGWSLGYETTPTDGFRVFNAFYNEVQMIKSIKLVEWHVQYGSFGFLDYTGCGGISGGNYIMPFGETQIQDILDPGNNIIGFELIQDFRMINWGQNCNYRYDQHFQFFTNGSFRVVQGAYGKGCGTSAFYRAVVRLDMAIRGEPGDQFDYWDGTQWVHLITEDYRVPYFEFGYGPHLTNPEGYAWKIYDITGAGYFIEMDTGQFGDGGRGDNPFLYITQYHDNEGATDLPLVGTCCNTNHLQGPHVFLNGESVDDQNLVLWYVPQARTNADLGNGPYYCWTVSTSETYPCSMGPMFHLIGPVEPFPLTEKFFLPFISKSGISSE